MYSLSCGADHVIALVAAEAPSVGYGIRYTVLRSCDDRRSISRSFLAMGHTELCGVGFIEATSALSHVASVRIMAADLATLGVFSPASLARQ